MKKIKYLILILSIISLVTIFYIKFFSKDISIKPFGIQVFTVQSNSMEPIFNRGDIIIIKEENEYKEGDIVTYELNDNEFITHRIIEIRTCFLWIFEIKQS